MGSTHIIAGYAAIVATAVLLWDIYKWKSSGAKIYLSVLIELHRFPTKEDRFIRVTATNTGDRPTTISVFGFLYYENWFSFAKSFLPLIQGKPDKFFSHDSYNLPYVLKPGDLWTSRPIEDKKIQEMAKEGLLVFAIYASHTEKPTIKRVRLAQYPGSTKQGNC